MVILTVWDLRIFILIHHRTPFVEVLGQTTENSFKTKVRHWICHWNYQWIRVGTYLSDWGLSRFNTDQNSRHNVLILLTKLKFFNLGDVAEFNRLAQVYGYELRNTLFAHCNTEKSVHSGHCHAVVGDDEEAG